MGFITGIGKIILGWLLEKIWGLLATYFRIKQKVSDAKDKNKEAREQLEKAETKEERDKAAEIIIGNFGDKP